jgi:hypothetical protein
MRLLKCVIGAMIARYPIAFVHSSLSVSVGAGSGDLHQDTTRRHSHVRSGQAGEQSLVLNAGMHEGETRESRGHKIADNDQSHFS